MRSWLGWLVVGEWALTLCAAVAFLVLYGWPNRYQDRTMAWHVFSVTAVAAVESAGLVAAGLHIHLPLWLYAVIYGAGAVVVIWRVWLLLKGRRRKE